MKSTIIKRSVVVAGHKTSVSLEDPFWKELSAIAAERDTTLSGLVNRIASERQYGNLSSAVRLFVLNSLLDQLSVIGARHEGSHQVKIGAVRDISSNPRPGR
jgi:predicted DNA-binding ribbon-helix-helix protein